VLDVLAAVALAVSLVHPVTHDWEAMALQNVAHTAEKPHARPLQDLRRAYRAIVVDLEVRCGRLSLRQVWPQVRPRNLLA
jgi:hypothetical protein